MASDQTRILMLHRILPDTPTAFGLPGSYRLRGTALTPAELDLLLTHHGPVIALAAVEDALAAGRPPPPGVVLTFDDGYREHLDPVARQLAARGLEATFYVAAGLHAEARAVAPVDAWYWCLDHATRPVATLRLPDGTDSTGRLDTVADKTAWISGPPKAALLAAPPEAQAELLARLAHAVGAPLPADLARRLYLRPADWRTLSALGMRVGAHSVHHPRLTQLSPAAQAREIADSITPLRPLGPITFAYPDGAYDTPVVAQVARCGARSAVTCDPGDVLPGADPLRLPRWFIHPAALAAAAG